PLPGNELVLRIVEHRALIGGIGTWDQRTPLPQRYRVLGTRVPLPPRSERRHVLKRRAAGIGHRVVSRATQAVRVIVEEAQGPVDRESTYRARLHLELQPGDPYRAYALCQKCRQARTGIDGGDRQLQVRVIADERRDIGTQLVLEPLALEAELVGFDLLRTETRDLGAGQRPWVEAPGLVAGGELQVAHDVRRPLVGHACLRIEARDADVAYRIRRRESRQEIPIVGREQARRHDAFQVRLETVEGVALGLVGVAAAELDRPAGGDAVI